MTPDINVLFVVLAALVPMITGAIFYGPLFGKQWMSSLGFTEESIPEPIKMPIVYVVSLLTSFLLAYSLAMIIEFTHRGLNDAGELVFMSDHTFGHGAYHGVQFGLMIAMPVLISNLLFQRNKASNIIMNVVYWLIALALMGGVVEAFA